MDLNKLPRLSSTEASANEPPALRVEPVVRTGAAEAWISAIVGIIFILIGKSFPAYVITKALGRTYHTGANWVAGPLEGQEVAYPDLQGFVMLTDSAMFLFGATLLFDAAVIAIAVTGFRFKRQLLVFALAVSVISTLFNLYAAIRLLSVNVLPLWSLIAVAFGGYIAMYQWKFLQRSPRLATG